MKTKIYIVAIILISSIASFAQAPNWLWSKNAGGSNSEYAKSVAVDASGNIYVVGWFSSPTITFGSTTLTNTNTNSSSDIFLVKYDANGNVLWAKKEGGISNDGGLSIAVNITGDIYIAGTFQSSTITFGSFILLNTSSYTDLFLTKYDSNGNVLWAKSATGTGGDYPCSVIVDVSGNAYLSGYFLSPTITFGSSTLTNINSYSDIFLAKYDYNGNALWAKSAGGIYGDKANSVVVDAFGNTYITGSFSSTIVFGSTTLTSAGSSDIFLVKYDINGNVIWAKSAGGTGGDDAFSIAMIILGDIYIVGDFQSSTICLLILSSTWDFVFINTFFRIQNFLIKNS